MQEEAARGGRGTPSQVIQIPIMCTYITKNLGENQSVVLFCHVLVNAG